MNLPHDQTIWVHNSSTDPHSNDEYVCTQKNYRAYSALKYV